MDTINVYDAKTQLSKLIDTAAAGTDVVIGRHGKPLVRLTRLDPPPRRVRFGVLKGKLHVPADFDAPLAPDVIAAFGGG